MPFGNVVVKVNMTGEQLLSMLEWSVHDLNNITSTGNLFGAYLQYSGLQVVYDVSKPPSSRVVSVKVQCAACRVPSYSALQKNATYNVLVNDFIAKGGDGFHMLESLERTSLGITTAEILQQYFQKHSPVYTGTEWRISYKINEKTESFSNKGIMQQSVKMTILLPIITWLLLT